MSKAVTLLFTLCSLLFITPASAQNKADDIIGTYYSDDPFSDESSKNEIYRVANGTYEAKVVWVSNPEKRKFIGYVFMRGLKFNAADNEWQGGTITYPGRSGTYRCYMRFTDDGRLRVRGYWGISLFGMTLYWKSAVSN